MVNIPCRPQEAPVPDPPSPEALIPVRQEMIAFYDDTIPAGELADGTIMVPLRPIAVALGLDWSGQAQRLKRDARLRAAQGVVIITTPGGHQSMIALPLRLLPGWLFKIDTARVRPELRAKIERYQEEAYEVLWQAFKGQILPAAPPAGAGAALARDEGAAVQQWPPNKSPLRPRSPRCRPSRDHGRLSARVDPGDHGARSPRSSCTSAPARPSVTPRRPRSPSR